MYRKCQYAEAEDIIGDTMLTMWRRYVVGDGAKDGPKKIRVGHTGSPEAVARNLIFRLAEYQRIDSYRSRQKEAALLSDPNVFFANRRTPIYEEPEQQVCWEETKQEAQKTIASLPEQQRRAVVYRVAGLAAGEAASRLEITGGTYRTHLAHARKRLAPVFSHQENS